MLYFLCAFASLREILTSYEIVKIDGPVKSRSQRICHFDQREKSYIFNMFRIQDFSLRSK